MTFQSIKYNKEILPAFPLAQAMRSVCMCRHMLPWAHCSRLAQAAAAERAASSGHNSSSGGGDCADAVDAGQEAAELTALALPCAHLLAWVLEGASGAGMGGHRAAGSSGSNRGFRDLFDALERNRCMWQAVALERSGP